MSGKIELQLIAFQPGVKDIKDVGNYPKEISCLTETFRGCQIHFRKIQLDKGRVVV